MTPARDQQGLTLIELLVAMAMTLILIAAAVAILTVFLNDYRYDGLRDQAQNDAQTLVNRISRELRSAASATTSSQGLLERANPYDLIFETVNPGTAYGGSNASNQYRVRYCLDGNETLWRQSETWTTATAPAVPSSTACPDTSSSDYVQSHGSACCVELNDVTNEVGGDTTRPLFQYGPSGASLSQISQVQVNVITDLNPGHLPGPSPQLTTGVFLRNENSPPVSSFSVTQVGSPGDVQLNGTASSDPNGQVLQYQWYNGGSCPSPTTALTGGTTPVFDAGSGYSKGSSQSFSLIVTDTQGLTNCSSQTVTIQ